jgi:hypothetical protein
MPQFEQLTLANLLQKRGCFANNQLKFMKNQVFGFAPSQSK